MKYPLGFLVTVFALSASSQDPFIFSVTSDQVNCPVSVSLEAANYNTDKGELALYEQVKGESVPIPNPGPWLFPLYGAGRICQFRAGYGDYTLLFRGYHFQASLLISRPGKHKPSSLQWLRARGDRCLACTLRLAKYQMKKNTSL